MYAFLLLVCLLSVQFTGLQLENSEGQKEKELFLPCSISVLVTPMFQSTLTSLWAPDLHSNCLWGCHLDGSQNLKVERIQMAFSTFFFPMQFSPNPYPERLPSFMHLLSLILLSVSYFLSHSFIALFICMSWRHTHVHVYFQCICFSASALS